MAGIWAEFRSSTPLDALKLGAAFDIQEQGAFSGVPVLIGVAR